GPTLRRLADAVDGLAYELDPVRILRVSAAANFVDRMAGCRAALDRVVDDGRAGGAMVSAIGAQTLLGLDDLRTGRWDAAVERAREAEGWCEEHGYPLSAWPPRFILAAVAG